MRMVISYWDMAASFVASGMLNQELFFKTNGECLFVWERVRLLAPAIRAMYKNPNAWGNLEAVGNAFIKQIEANGPEAYPAFQAMVHGATAAGAAILIPHLLAPAPHRYRHGAGDPRAAIRNRANRSITSPAQSVAPRHPPREAASPRHPASPRRPCVWRRLTRQPRRLPPHSPARAFRRLVTINYSPRRAAI